MGYWEQTGRDNQEDREREAKRPRWRRIDWAFVPVAAVGLLITGMIVVVTARAIFGR